MTDPDTQATATALGRIADAGSDMKRPMEIDFFVALPTEASAQALAPAARALGYAVAVETDEETDTWTCYCSKTMVPDLDAVRQCERELDDIARHFGGQADGFGSYGNAAR